jgi:cytochrome c553
MRLIALVPLFLLCASCVNEGGNADVAALKAEVAELKARPAAQAAAPAVELGQQMLELQIRHARLWQAGEARNWLLTQFQLAELREALEGVVELNGDHAALQPQRLADVLPAMMTPPLDQLQQAVDAQDLAKFEAAYDAVSNACSGCHAASDHAFLVIQRPQTPILDNLRSAAAPTAP